MRIGITADGDLPAIYRTEITKGKAAFTSAIRDASTELKTRWRAQIRAANMGRKLPNTIRSDAWPKGTISFRAAGKVWTTAPEIIGAHDQGTVIRSADGFWLAIPLPAAGRGRGGRRLTPLTWERQNNMPLRFVFRPGKPAILVADDARLRVGKRTSGRAARKGGRRRKDGILTGAQTIPIFVLVPQVRLRKRLDLDRDVQAVAATLDTAIVSRWAD